MFASCNSFFKSLGTRSSDGCLRSVPQLRFGRSAKQELLASSVDGIQSLETNNPVGSHAYVDDLEWRRMLLRPRTRIMIAVNEELQESIRRWEVVCYILQ